MFAESYFWGEITIAVERWGEIDGRWKVREALNFERWKIWVWEDDAFRHHRIGPSKVDWMTLVDQADRWDFLILSRCVRKTAIKQLCISIQRWLIDSMSCLCVCCSRIHLDLPATFRNRYFILSSLPPSPSSSPIDTDRKTSQKLISLITSTLLSVVEFEFFEDLSSIILSDEVLHHLFAGGLTFWGSKRILMKSGRVEVISRESPIGAPRRYATHEREPLLGHI
jgi:hypothetical protein